MSDVKANCAGDTTAQAVRARERSCPNADHLYEENASGERFLRLSTPDSPVTGQDV